jgi:hypothetical protein
MARPLRIEFPGAIYHVVARGNAREAIVRADADRDLFLDALGEVVTRFGAKNSTLARGTTSIRRLPKAGGATGNR